ncbi:hypothetical protein C7402_13127 [Paraburkholderia unamae]|uniref:Uncharacterized protein n=2 Tax=Paraburkholderia unamae TaxID=219649 RepID=A0ABX5K8Y6_9BURK|nr:hypothetical protein C7402_13127 [Paraburkholderia unamae]CAG9247010.1 conserved hypothetical protein [Paraburkholderia unamae]
METRQQVTMTSGQQEELLQDIDIGFKWVKGQFSIDDVIKKIGKPDRISNQNDCMEYRYYPHKLMTVVFHFDKIDYPNGNPVIGTFSISVGNDVHTNIPYESFDNLGMKRIARGERLDSVRIENADFFSPDGVIDTSGSLPKNYVSFGWRLPMPEDSPYDIKAAAAYLGEWINPNGEKVFGNFRNAVDLRKVVISRSYLLPDDLNKRNHAKREKYGYMNLRTGMTCPETGLWEGWTKECGATDILQLEKGQKFDMVRTVPVYKDRSSCPMVEGQWMWLCSLVELSGFSWYGITLKG